MSRRSRLRWGLVLVLASAALLLAACEKPDASYTTSPSLKALIGTTVGNVAFDPPETAPDPVDPPDRWSVDFNLALFTNLENDSPALQVLMGVETRPGYGFELWISGEDGKTVARWSAGSTAVYTGTACFQLELQRDGEAVPLPPGKYTATIVFRDPEGPVLAARRIDITNFTPELKGTVPGPESEVFREAWACRRGQ
jgi:hypothetical protein